MNAGRLSAYRQKSVIADTITRAKNFVASLNPFNVQLKEAYALAA